jgi:hypothetical protein
LQPHAELQGGSFGFAGDVLANINWNVLKGFSESTQFALNDNLTSLDIDGDSLWDFEFLFGNNILHD